MGKSVSPFMAPLHILCVTLLKTSATIVVLEPLILSLL